jgi:hypothetical protein
MKIQLLAITGIFIFAMPFTSLKAEEPHCVKVSESGVAALFDRWNTSLATLDPDKVMENYGPNAVLLPTLSNKPRTKDALVNKCNKTFRIRINLKGVSSIYL